MLCVAPAELDALKTMLNEPAWILDHRTSVAPHARSWQATSWRPMQQLSAPSWRPAGRCKSCLVRQHRAWAWRVSRSLAASAPDTPHGSCTQRDACLQDAMCMGEHACISQGRRTHDVSMILWEKAAQLLQACLQGLAAVEGGASCRGMKHTSADCLSCVMRVPDAHAGVVEAVAAAKRALSSHPLPDPFQPSGKPLECFHSLHQHLLTHTSH